MIKELSLTALLFAGLATAANAQRGYDGNVTFTPTKVKTAKDSIRLSFDIVLDNVRLGSRAQMNLKPRLVSQDKTQTYEFAPISVAGGTRYIMWKRGGRKTPQPIRKRGAKMIIPVSVAAPNVAWIKQARLEVAEQVQGCAECELSKRNYLLTERITKEEYKPNFSVAYITPEAEAVKLRSERFIARFSFRVNRTELLPNLGNNRAEFARVDSVARAILLNQDVKVKNVNIDGYASPEGSEASNIRLAQGRAQSFVKYLRTTYRLSTDLFNVQGHGEDWDGFVKAINESDTQWKMEILDIVNNTMQGNVRKTKLKKLDRGEAYKYLLEVIFPALRRTEYQFAYTVRSFNLDEAIARINTNPGLLSLNEMYLVANHFPEGSPERKDALEKATRFFPTNPVSRFNAIAGALASGQLGKDDENFLQGYRSSPEQLNNLGVFYAIKKDYEKAADCFKRAGSIKEAEHNLEELSKVAE